MNNDAIKEYLNNISTEINIWDNAKTEEAKEYYASGIKSKLTKLEEIFAQKGDYENIDRLRIISEKFNSEQLTEEIKNPTKNIKRKIVLLAAGAALLVAGTWALAKNNTEASNIKINDSTTVKSNENDFDSNRFTKHPLVATTQDELATAWGQWAADNGILDMENGTDRFTIAAVATTFASGNVNADKYSDELALGKNFTDHGSIKSNVDSIRADHEQVLLAKRNIDYTNLLTRKNSIKMLNNFNNVWTTSDVNPTQEQINNFNKLFEDFIIDKDNYDPFTIFLVNDYVTMATESGLTPFENSEVFAKALDECCAKNNACSVDDKNLDASNTIESKSSVLLYSSFEDLRNDNEHDHLDSELYSSYDEINKKVSEKVSKMTNADVNLQQEAIEQSEEMAHAKVDRTYGVKDPVLPTDNIQSDGTIDSGKTEVVDKVGDATDEVEKDNSGVEKEPDYDTMWELGWNDYILELSNKPLANSSYKGNKGYDDGWNAAVQNNPKKPDGSGTTDEKDNMFAEPKPITPEQQPITPEQQPITPEQQPITPEVSNPETSQPDNTTEIPKENIVEEKEEDVIYDGYYKDENGIFHPIPDEATIISDTPAKTR